MSESVPCTLLYIDGHYVPASDNETFQVRNPYSGLVVGTAASASSKDCTAAIEAAANAFKSWENSNLNDRRDIFLKAADIVATEKYRTRIVEAIQEETSGDTSWGIFNWRTAGNFLRSQVGMLNQLRGEVYQSGVVPGAHVLAQRRAMGVWFVLSPFLSSLICPDRIFVASPLPLGMHHSALPLEP